MKTQLFSHRFFASFLPVMLILGVVGSTPGRATPKENRAMISITVPETKGDVAKTSLANELRIEDAATEIFRISLPKIPDEKRVRLSLKARIDWPDLAGSNPFMTVQINGHALTLSDLVNKEHEFTMRDGSDTTWAYGAVWRLMYAPDFSDDVKTKKFAYGVPDTDPFGFAWDITPYLKTGENTIAFTQLKVLTQPTALELRDIEIEIGAPMSAATSQVTPAPTGALPVYIAREKQKIAMQVALSKNGELQFQIGARSFAVSTRTSLPDGKWLSTTSGTGSTPGIQRGQSARARWKGSNYEIAREVSVRDDHIKIADTIRNTDRELLGVIYENRLQLTEKPEEVLLAGRPAFAETYGAQAPEHPTALARWKDVVVGLVAEDDVFRVHHKTFVEPGVLGLKDDQLGIAPGKSHTLEWSIYPQPSGDYWSFINAIRRNWSSNYQIPFVAFDFGGLEKGKITQQEHCRRVQARGAKWLLSNQTVYEPDEIAPDETVRPQEVEQLKNRKGGALVAEGTGILFAKQWLARARDWSEKIHNCDANLKTLIYIHTQILTEPKHYEKYAGDFVKSATGENVFATYTFPLPLYLPTPENTYGQALLKAVPEILRQTKADGFYNDEMDYSTTPYDYNPNVWDGATVVIDPKTHAITGKRSSVILLQQPWKVAFAELLRDNGKVLFGNGAPSTRTLQNLHTPRFVETASYSFLINTHFNTPLGLGNHDVVRDEATRARMVRRFLDNGALMVAYLWDDEPKEQPHYLSLMYPITPEELRAGMVLGRERIVTNRSGRYGWKDGEAADVFVFDGEGRRVKNPDVKAVRGKEGVLTELRMPSDHFAILVKRTAAN